MAKRPARSRPPDEAPEPAPGLFDALPAPAPAREPGERPPEPASREPRPEPAPPPLFTVGQLSSAIHQRLNELGRVRVEGEVSQRKRTASGHVYFDLKDPGAKLACKIWQSKAAQILRFELVEGAQVIAWGRLDVYAPQGSYSLIVDRLEARGVGALLAELERRKAELKARGWFERKRALPAMPRCIGLVTSRDGAALRDFLRTRSLRWPGYPVRLCHTPVQGPGAAESIAAALRALEASGVDLIVLARGGGSLEDLWAFNELAVAEAIWAMRVPVVTGIGHESDVTVADFVADRRAHTPTDAAQSVIPDRAELDARVARLGHYLVEAMERQMTARGERLERARGRPVLRDAAWILAQRRRALLEGHSRLDAALRGALARRAEKAARAATRLERRSPRVELARRERILVGARARLGAAALRALVGREGELAAKARTLQAVSPLAVLGRGFSLTRPLGGGPAVRDAAALAPGDVLETELARGSFVARVESVRSPAENGGSEGKADA